MYSIQVRKENPFNQTLRVTFTGLVKYAHMIYGIEHKGIEYGILTFNSLVLTDVGNMIVAVPWRQIGSMNHADYVSRYNHKREVGNPLLSL